MDISIIIPAYNVKDQVAAGVASVLNQEFDGQFEIILVDDASTDGTNLICEELASEHKKLIRYFTCSQNSGVSAARNIGLKTAVGRYIVFVDPDDILANDALTLLYDAAEKNSADIVKGNNQILMSGKYVPASYNVDLDQSLTGDDILESLFEHKVIRGHPWGKIFRRESLVGIEFPLGVKMAQDLRFMFLAAKQARKLVFIKENVYFYKLRADGATGGKYKSGAYKHWIEAVENSDNFIFCDAHEKQYISLKLKTMHQVIRELNQLKSPELKQIFKYVNSKKKDWGLSFSYLFEKNIFSMRAYFRLLQINIMFLIFHYKNKL